MKKSCFASGSVQSRQNSNSDFESSIKSQQPCHACVRDSDVTDCMHNMRSCLVWGGLSYQDRVSLVKCVRHPFSKDDHTTAECKRTVGSCMFCKKDNDHNSMLCPNFSASKKSSDRFTK